MIQEIRGDLNARARSLHEKKKQVKESQRKGSGSRQSDLCADRWDYRHRHVAYCLGRGRTMDQIERNPKRPLDDKLLKEYLDGYRLHVAIKKGELKKAPAEPKKLYVVVDDMLPYKYATVQAIHAVAEYMKEHQDWSNGTLVILKAAPRLVQSLANNFGWVPFREPDLEGRLTAVSRLQENNSLVKDLSLL